MISGPRRWIRTNTTQKTKDSLHDNQFEWNYVMLFASMATLGFFIFSGPLLYFTMNNYQLFETIAYDTYPQIIANLYQEKNWLLISFILSSLFIFGSFIYFGKRFTNNTLKPIKVIENHLHLLLLGKFYEEVKFSDDSQELKSIKINYDYFYRVLRSSTEQELEILKTLNIDEKNRDSLLAWQRLIQLKCNQLGLDSKTYLTASPNLTLAPTTPKDDTQSKAA